MSRPIGNYGDFNITYLDAGGEKSSIKGTAVAVTVSPDTLGSQLTLFQAFITKCAALKLGTTIGSRYVTVTEAAEVRPTNGANRETKLLVQYQNTATGKRYTMTLPTLSPTIPVYVDNINAKDVIRMDTPAAISEFVTAFNAFVIDPQIPIQGDGSYDVAPACTVVGLQVVGRNI